MKRFFDIANQYCRESDWKTMAMLKFCLLSIGLIIGVLLPASCKTAILMIFGAIFIVTYVPLMVKYFHLWGR